MAPMPLQQGDPSQIGHYRLTARLGAGGMGVVYLGQAGDGQQVAVKVLRPEYAHDPEFRARFQREVAAMARVRNRYTVQVLDADTDSATPFLATQFAEGPSLDEHVKTQGPLYPEAVFRLATALAEALAAIHAAGVTHRDLKPSNVLLTNSGPMVIDFGIAQIADTVSITRTGMAIGSPGYMAPEQVTGNAGREADIFTWALIVAYAASGRPPFGTGETVGILHRILNENPDISAVPPQLMPLVQGALAKDPARRPEALDLLRELSPGAAAGMAPATAAGAAPTVLDAQAGAGYPGDTARTRALYGDPQYGDTQYGDPQYGGPGPRRSRRWRGFAVAALVVAALAGTGAALLSNGGSSSNGQTGGTSPAPATGPASPATGKVTDTGPGTQTQAPPGHSRKHKHKDNGDGGGTGDNSGSGGGAATSSPSASPVPSATASPSVAPTTGPTGGSTPTSGPGGG